MQILSYFISLVRFFGNFAQNIALMKQNSPKTKIYGFFWKMNSLYSYNHLQTRWVLINDVGNKLQFFNDKTI